MRGCGVEKNRGEREIEKSERREWKSSFFLYTYVKLYKICFAATLIGFVCIQILAKIDEDKGG